MRAQGPRGRLDQFTIRLMASFGLFETERELYSDPTYTVYSARKPGEPQTAYAVKLFPPPPAEATVSGTESADVAGTRAERIAIQEKAAASSAFIAPVLASGQDTRGVWYVTRLYPRSANKMIIGRVALGADALRHILQSIARGAVDLKRACGRSHGDIRTSNIQISKSDKVHSAEVVLSDPLPGGSEQAVRYELNDLHAIGLVLLELVRLRLTPPDEVPQLLPILNSPDWTRFFGPEAEEWVSLCNRLLDPNLTLDQFTLEQLVTRLEPPPKPPLPRKTLIGAGAGALGVILLVWVLFHHSASPKAKGDHADRVENSNQVVSLVTSNPANHPSPDTNSGRAAPSRNGVFVLSALPIPALILDSNGILREASSEKPLVLTNPLGSYQFTARSALGEKMATLTVRNHGVTNYTFVFDYATVKLDSVPPGASVSSDGAVSAQGGATAVAPAMFFQRPGMTSRYRIEKPSYVPSTNEWVAEAGATNQVTVALQPQAVTIELVSDPPGARFMAENGTALAAIVENDSYSLPWGVTNLVAKYPRLGNLTNQVDIKPPGESPASPMRYSFNFDYGVLVLSNLPPGVLVSEDKQALQPVHGSIYETLGPHRYVLELGDQQQSIVTNIARGPNFLGCSLGGAVWSHVPPPDVLWTNGFGVAFAWVANLPDGGLWTQRHEQGGWVGRFEVTQGQYKKLMKHNPSSHPEGDQHPVENLSWDEAAAFCRELNQADAGECGGWHYRLPTQKQFMFMVGDAEKHTKIMSENKNNAPFGPRSGIRRHPERVGIAQANRFRLFDLLGNVSEWLQPEAGSSEKIHGGGSFDSYDVGKPSQYTKRSSGKAEPDVGFRVILVP